MNSNFDYDKIKKERESNYLRLVIIGALGIILVIGGADFQKGKIPEGVKEVTTLSMPNKENLTRSFKEDVYYYIPNVKKTNIFRTHKQTKTLASDLGNLQMKVSQLKQEEDQLRTLISNVPIEIYNHSKLDLTAFMVEELKNRNLIYSIKYNYDLNQVDEEEGDNTESQSGEEVDDVEGEDGEVEIEKPKSSKITPITEAFLVRIYQVDKEDNYSKVMDLLDTIYIKEPYEIIKFEMGYDKISRSYFLEYVIGV